MFFCNLFKRICDFKHEKLVIFLMGGVCACAPFQNSPNSSSPFSCLSSQQTDFIYVVGEGWHAQIGIPVDELQNNLAFLPSLFLGAHVIMIGYGKKTFFTAEPENLSEYILGPFPGTAVIQVVGLNTTPMIAYPGSSMVVALPPHGLEKLEKYISDDLAFDEKGKPKLVALSHNPEGLFYGANSEYTLLHTCNAWTAEVLQAGGLNISSDGVIFSEQVLNRLTNAISQECQS